MGICDDGYGGTAWWPVMDGGPYWSLVSFSPETLTAQEYAARIPVQYVLQNTISDAGNDGQVTATSDLFLYTVHFHHPDPGVNTPPRKAGDKSVNVGCCLMPSNVPAAWINRIELTLWDPAYPNMGHKRVITGPSGQAWISTMWNGKLYVDGNEGTTPYYTQASDVFMEAKVIWNLSTPQKLWENSGECTFQEPRYAIIASDGMQPVSSSPTNFAWIDASPSMPSLTAHVAANGTASLPETADWHLHVTFNRPTRNDSDTYPTGTPGYATVPGGEEWVADFGADFLGGTCRMTSTFGGRSLDHLFHIRGNNASRETTIAYIDQNNNGHSYAWAIAQVESEIHHFNPATQQNPLPGPNELTDLVAQPSRGTSTPYGWGLFQLTQWDLPPHGTWDYPQPEHLWNWKTNTTVAIQILDDCKNTVQDFENAVSRTFNYPYGWDYVAAPDVLSFSSLEAATIQGFNSWSMSWQRYLLIGPDGLPRQYPSTCWRLYYWIIDETWYEFVAWEFVENTKNYVHVVDAIVTEGQ